MRRTMDGRLRFAQYVEVSEDPAACWSWRGKIDKWGYGHTTWHQRHMLAHRVAWIIANGEIPSGLLVCHHCDNPRCVNPAHLFLGTPADNVHDMYAKGRNPDRSKPRRSRRRNSDMFHD